MYVCFFILKKIFISNIIELFFPFFFLRPPEENRQTMLEKQIDMALSMNYEKVRDLFNSFDNFHNGTITTNDLRSIIEDLMDYTLKPDEYYQLIKQIPIDENGRIKYKEYLKQVLDRALHLQEQPERSSKYYFFLNLI